MARVNLWGSLSQWGKRWNAGEGRVNLSELCHEFGISRQVRHGWVARYRKANHDVRAVASVPFLT